MEKLSQHFSREKFVLTRRYQSILIPNKDMINVPRENYKYNIFPSGEQKLLYIQVTKKLCPEISSINTKVKLAKCLVR